MLYSHFVRHVADGQYSMPDDMPNAGFPIVGGNYMTYRAFLRSVDTYQKCPAVSGVFCKTAGQQPGILLFLTTRHYAQWPTGLPGGLPGDLPGGLPGGPAVCLAIFPAARRLPAGLPGGLSVYPKVCLEFFC